MSSLADVVTMFLTIQNNIKIYHWTTKTYARHKAADELYEKLDQLFDRFIETYIGRYEKTKISISSLTVKQHLDKDMLSYLEETRKNIETLPISHGDLKNLKDEILGALSQGIYLFRLV